MYSKKVCVVGLGYIGLPSASLLATKGYQVLGVDINKSIVTALNNGDILIHEPSLDVMVKSAVASGRLTADTKASHADIYVLAVPTPFDDGFVPNVNYIYNACVSIAPYLQPGNIIILESTSPVGTTENICKWLQEKRPDLTFPHNIESAKNEQIYVAHCPERVIPGRILEELVSNDRVIGGVDYPSTLKAIEFYKTFVQGEIGPTNSKTAELVKLMENAYRDVNIAFANEISIICDKFGIDVWESIELANRHPRVNILNPGPGVGGHCIAVDPWFIISCAPEESKLLHAARQVNTAKPNFVLSKIKNEAEKLQSRKIACFGLAYKENTDDLRESPSLEIVTKLILDGYQVSVVEPFITKLPESIKNKAKLLTADEALKTSDIIVFLVAHSQFKELDKNRLSGKIVIDCIALNRKLAK